MSFSVSIHPPKTPITAGSGGVAKATIPNVCKMPGPPAPFVPSPLPNIAKSGNSPDGYSTSVKIEGEAIAIRGATFQSMGDEASKGTGGGLISANTQGIAKFILPGTMDVKIEGKGVHLKGDQMLNNCAAGGSPPNTGATMTGADNPDGSSDAETALKEIMCNCNENTPKPPGGCKEHGIAKHQCCEDAINSHTAPPEIGGERGYSKAGKLLSQSREQLKAAGKLAKGMCFPDACAMSGGQPTQFFDFKFPCGGEADANFYFPAGKSQFDKYKKLSKKLGITADPVPLTSRSC